MAGYSSASWAKWCARNGCITKDTPPPFTSPNTTFGYTPFEHGVTPLYTPVGGSWLNMAESLQRILKRRALDGQHPTDVARIMAWFKSVAEHWNAAPTPFEWGGKRAARRRRQRERRHRLGGSGACTREPIRRGPDPSYGHRHAK
jgi:hypothetical protein